MKGVSDSDSGNAAWKKTRHSIFNTNSHGVFFRMKSSLKITLCLLSTEIFRWAGNKKKNPRKTNLIYKKIPGTNFAS